MYNVRKHQSFISFTNIALKCLLLITNPKALFTRKFCALYCIGVANNDVAKGIEGKNYRKVDSIVRWFTFGA